MFYVLFASVENEDKHRINKTQSYLNKRAIDKRLVGI